jgi:fimbrial chaperone protein
VVVKGDKLMVAARNSGERRVRISALNLRDASGKSISFGNGLAGYALGQSTKTWVAPGNARGFVTNGPASISAQSDGGPIAATATVSGR